MKTSLSKVIAQLPLNELKKERKDELTLIINYIKDKITRKQPLHLNFICTHNSRRSQFSQLWAKVMAHYHGIDCSTYSGGVEVTACNERVINTLLAQGFDINVEGKDNNPHYHIRMDNVPFGVFFSKLYDDSSSPSKDFAAIMTCAHADENCPFIPGAEQRIPVRYKDPKAYDDTPEESTTYLNKSIEIAVEMHYIFSSIG